MIVRLAIDEAQRLGVNYVRYEVGNVTELVVEPKTYDIVYARFVMSHLARPDLMLTRIATWIRPGGSLVIEDVDIPGAVCTPASPAFDRANDLMARAMRRSGGDPELGRQLPVLLGQAGFDDVATTVVQPGCLDGDAKQIQLLTLITITEALNELDIATPSEIEQVRTELAAFVERPDTYATTARIFQCVARRRQPQRQAATTSRSAQISPPLTVAR